MIGTRFVWPTALFAMLAVAVLPLDARAAHAQRDTTSPAAVAMRTGVRQDLDGNTAAARRIFQGLIDSAATPEARSAAERAMAMSYAFDGDCKNTVKYEQKVIDYWHSREHAEPQTAFFEEGEIADEAARVCIDAGDLGAAEHWYRVGYELGTKEPPPLKHPRSLWEFRLAHALGRLAARRGDTTEAKRQIDAARRILDGDSAMAAQQERFFPYLVGYVALYTNDSRTALAQFQKAIAMKGNERDPFLLCLLGMTYERMGSMDTAKGYYQQAVDLATAHNPPSAFVHRFVRSKLGPPGP